MSNIVPLKLQGTSDLTAVSTGLKGIATEAKNAGGPLNTLTKSLDQTEKSTTSLGQKVKSFGSKFGVLTASVGSLAGSMVGLVRQYQDLGDSQIAVEKATRRVSTADVGVKKAKDALTAAIAKYGKGSKEAALKTQELANAESLLSVNTQLLTERQEDHQRAQENFWIGLVPTITSAGGTIMGVLQNLIGKKGFGGVAEAVASATTAIGTGGGGGKGGGGAGSGFLGSLLTLAKNPAVVGGTLGALGAGLTLQQAETARSGMAASGLFADPLKDYQKNLKQTEIFMEATKAKGYEMFFMFDDLKKKFLETNPVLDATGQIIVDIGTKTSAVAPSLGAANTALISLANTAADWLTKGASLSQVNELVRQSGISLADQTFVMREAWAEYTIAQEAANQAMAVAASNSQFLDANLQPIVQTTGSLVDVLTRAETSLAASGSGINAVTQATTNGVTSAQNWIETSKLQAVQSRAFQQELLKEAQDLYGSGIAADTDAKILQALIDAQSLAAAGSIALADAKLKEAQAMLRATKGVTTYAAAAVHLTNLVPKSRITGRGPRNPNFRLRSDYQTPLIGSALSQRQQLAGTRGPGKTHIKIKKAQTGMNEWLSEDTMIMAHAGERVDISPKGKGSNIHMTVTFEPAEFARFLRYRVNDKLGVMK